MTNDEPIELSGSSSTELVVVDLPRELQTHSGMIGAVYSAIDAQRAVAISYVRGIRRRQPDGTPGDVIKALERHYLLSVTASGTAVGATAFIPGAGTVVALGAGAAELLLQFELAALFGLSVAEVHGLNIQDRDRARAVILTLMLGPEGRNQITNLAKSAIRKDASELTGTAGRSRQLSNSSSLDDLPLAELLGTMVPKDLVPSIVESAQKLAKEKLPEKAVATTTRLMPGGIGMVLGGIGGYTAGNDVIAAARQAFGELPEVLPEWLEPVDADGDGIPDPTAFETTMRGALGKFVEGSNSSAAGISSAAGAVGSGVTAAATNVSRSFRSVDLDGDGIPDEARALTAAKTAGSAIRGGAVGTAGAVGSLFKRKTRNDAAKDSDT